MKSSLLRVNVSYKIDKKDENSRGCYENTRVTALWSCVMKSEAIPVMAVEFRIKYYECITVLCMTTDLLYLNKIVINS